MVFAINAPDSGDKTYDAFKEKAKTANHPNPADHETADFTPPGAQSSAPPAGTDVPPSESSSAGSSAESSAGAPDTASLTSDTAQPTAVPTADQANVAPTAVPSADQANVAPSSSTPLTRSGALSAMQVPGAGIALTLAGLLAGMLL